MEGQLTGTRSMEMLLVLIQHISQIDTIFHLLHLLGFHDMEIQLFFGCAFLHDETAETFKWLFITFLKAMSEKAQKNNYN